MYGKKSCMVKNHVTQKITCNYHRDMYKPPCKKEYGRVAQAVRAHPAVQRDRWFECRKKDMDTGV